MVVKLFAPRVRPKAEHTIDRIICTLRHWLLGQGIAMLVVGIVTGIQFFEGNILQPIVQKRAIDLPPVLTLVALLVFGGAFGLLGLFVAAPMTAALLVLVEDLYLKEYLGTKDRLLE